MKKCFDFFHFEYKNIYFNKIYIYIYKYQKKKKFTNKVDFYIEKSNTKNN